MNTTKYYNYIVSLKYVTKTLLTFFIPQPPTSTTIPTFIYHDVEHERVSSHDVIGHEVLKEDDAPARLEIRQTIEPSMNQEYMYEFGNGNNTTKTVNMLILF